MKKQALRIPILILIIVLVVALTLTIIGLLNPLVFWGLAGLPAIFAFKILPKLKQ